MNEQDIRRVWRLYIICIQSAEMLGQVRGYRMTANLCIAEANRQLYRAMALGEGRS